MMRKCFWVIALLLALSNLAPMIGASAAQTTSGGQTPGDTLESTTYATFLAPAGWTLRTDQGSWVLTPPEADFDITVMDIAGAPDAKTAAAAAWQRNSAGFDRKLQSETLAAAKDGWEEIKNLDYETSPNEKQYFHAIANRASGHWTVVLLKGSIATFAKRGGAAQVTLGSLRPAGYVPENFAGKPAQRLDAAHVRALRQFVSDAMGTLAIPGAALALIDQGRIVFADGLGIREMGKSAKVDRDTLFMIASNTKGMTTLMLAKEVDEGLLAWTDKVTRVYPAFRLGSAATTEKVEIRHLICACTGMPRRDFPDAFTNRLDTPAAQVFNSLAATEPTSGFGETFQYSNTMAAAAGFVGGHAAYPSLELGAAYDKAMQMKVFAPLGMTHTTFDLNTALKANHASPHGTDIHGNLAIADIHIDAGVYPDRPAGGAWSSVSDVIKYVDNELRQGTLPNGTSYVSAKNLLIRRQANVQLGADSFYGMGLVGTRIAGITAFHHGGSLIGYRSEIYFIPEAGVGAVLLTNSESGEALLTPFLRRLIEVLYDGKPEAASAITAAAQPSALDALRKSLTWPVDPKIASSVAGRYTSADLGEVNFRYERGALTLSNGLWTVPMASKTNADGTQSVVTVGPGFTGLDFVIADSNPNRTLILRDSQHEYRLSANP